MNSTFEPDRTTTSFELEKMKKIVVDHFEDFVNRKDLSAIDRNMSANFYDHDGPGGRRTDVAGDREMMAQMHQMFPDLKVDIRDVIAEGDRVVVRNVWTGTNAKTGAAIWFQGFVMWRFAEGKIVERWATVNPIASSTPESLIWSQSGRSAIE